jgi:hypothetical protein
VNTNDLALLNQDQLMQTKPSPNMLRARMPAPRHLPEMFRLEEVVDFPAEVVHVVGGTKAAFNAAATGPAILPASLENVHGVVGDPGPAAAGAFLAGSTAVSWTTCAFLRRLMYR